MGPMVWSAQGFFTGKMFSLLLGFSFWLVAARVAAPDEVGLAAAAVSGSMLCVQFGLFGIEAAYVAAFAKYEGRRGKLLGSALVAVAAFGTLATVIVLLMARFLLEDMATVATSIGFAAAFLAMGVIGTVQALLDKVAMARRRGHEVASRNLVNGVVTIAPLAVYWALSAHPNAPVLFGVWVIGTLAGTVVALRQSRGAPSAYQGGIGADWADIKGLLGAGRSFYVLALAERTPVLVLPILVTEILSPADNAYWYPVWMIAWSVYLIPGSLGLALFAEGANDPSSLLFAARRAIRTSLVVGSLVAIAAAVLGPIALRLMGLDYADAGSLPLRIMVLAVVPLTVISTYFAICRAAGRLTEAIAVSSGSGLISLALASLGMEWWGLPGLAALWVAAQFSYMVPVGARIKTILEVDGVAAAAAAAAR